MSAIRSNRQLTDITIELTLAAPWLVHGNDPGHLGMDAVQLRRADGRRVIPGTLLAGRLRETWLSWRSAGATGVPDPTEWLGPAAQADDEEDACANPAAVRRLPRRSRVHVDDLVEVQAPAGQLQPATRVPISELTGAGADGMLQFVEQREAPGTLISFCGTWLAWLTPDERSELVNGIGKALQWQTQIGALRSIGFGEVEATRVVSRSVPIVQASWSAPGMGLSRGLRMRFDRPFVVGSRRIGGNLFASSDTVPGAAIKAALAHGFRQRGEPLPPWFDDLRITHGMPSRGGRRPAPIPLALVRGRDSQGQFAIWSVARTGAIALDATGAAVAFPIDWKREDFRAIDAQRGWGSTRSTLRVRTAIENGMAKDQSLFAYRAVEPGLDDDQTPQSLTPWVAQVDLPEPWAQDDAAWAALGRALAGQPLGPIGKTDAFASVELVDEPAWFWPPDPEAADDVAVVMLMTPALLGSSSALLDAGRSGGSLQQVYQTALDQAAEATITGSTGCFALQTFKASQQMVGGTYLHRRFMLTESYRPWVLTEAGSAFTLKILRPVLGRQVLRLWQTHGLPLGAQAVAEHGGDWQRNPYLRENGYGEVCVNPQWPFADLPTTNR